MVCVWYIVGGVEMFFEGMSVYMYFYFFKIIYICMYRYRSCVFFYISMLIFISWLIFDFFLRFRIRICFFLYQQVFLFYDIKIFRLYFCMQQLIYFFVFLLVCEVFEGQGLRFIYFSIRQFLVYFLQVFFSIKSF